MTHHRTHPGVGSVPGAWRHAHTRLAPLGDRWRHTCAVAATAEDLARRAGFSEYHATVLVVAAWCHDIGYGIPGGTGWHPVDGATWLHGEGLQVVAPLVAWHTTALEEACLNGRLVELVRWSRPTGLLPDLLTYADMTTGPTGQPVEFEERRDDVLHRYGAGSAPGRAMVSAWPRLVAVRDRVHAAVGDRGVP